MRSGFDVQSTADFPGSLLVCLLTLVDKHKKDCRYDDEGDGNVGKNQSGSEDALATIGTPGRRMAHPITAIRAELLRWLVSHFSPLINPTSCSLNLRAAST
jgi:hypothetical protein